MTEETDTVSDSTTEPDTTLDLTEETEATPPVGSNSSNPAISCLHIYQTTTSHTDGLYWLDPDDDEADVFQAYCDMTTDDGGWTLVSYMPNTSGVGGALRTADAHNLPGCANRNAICKFSDVAINDLIGYSVETEDRFRLVGPNLDLEVSYYWDTTTPWSYTNAEQNDWFVAAFSYLGTELDCPRHSWMLGVAHYPSDSCPASTGNEVFYLRTGDDQVGAWGTGPFYWYVR